MTEKKSKLSEFEKIEQLKKEDVLYNIYRITFVEMKSDDEKIKFIPVQYNYTSGLYQDISTGEVLHFGDNDSFIELAKNYENVTIGSTYSFKTLSELVSSNLYKYFTIKGNTNNRAKMQAYLIQNENDMLFNGRITTKQNILKFADKSAKILNKTNPIIQKYNQKKNSLEYEIAKKVSKAENMVH